jgi:hypothetical protein
VEVDSPTVEGALLLKEGNNFGKYSGKEFKGEVSVKIPIERPFGT